MNHRITRRIFLKGAAVFCGVAAAGVLSGCAREIPVAYVLPNGEKSVGGGVFQTQTLRSNGRTCTLRVTDFTVDQDRNLIVVALTIVNGLEFPLRILPRRETASEQGQLSLTARTGGSQPVTLLGCNDGGLAAALDNLTGQSIDPGRTGQGKLYLRADDTEWSDLTLTIRMHDGLSTKDAVFYLSR